MSTNTTPAAPSGNSPGQDNVASPDLGSPDYRAATEAGAVFKGSERAPIPIERFGIALGLAGLAGTWKAATLSLGASDSVNQVLFFLATAAWLGLFFMYCSDLLSGRRTLRRDVDDPQGGPLLAFIPVTATLLAAHYSQYSLAVGRYLCAVSIATLALLAARLFSRWLTAGETLQTLHPGYLVPVAPAAFVSSIALSALNAHNAAIAAFGAGVFFWLVMAAVVTVRLMGGRQLPAAAVPTFSALLVAAATANLAWLVSHAGPLTQPQYALAGILAMMLLVQLFLLPEYRKLPFNLGFWTFTFPVAVTANFLIRWFSEAGVEEHAVGAWGCLAVATVFIAFVAARSLAFAGRRRYSARS